MLKAHCVLYAAKLTEVGYGAGDDEDGVLFDELADDLDDDLEDAIDDVRAVTTLCFKN